MALLRGCWQLLVRLLRQAEEHRCWQLLVRLLRRFEKHRCWNLLVWLLRQAEQRRWLRDGRGVNSWRRSKAKQRKGQA